MQIKFVGSESARPSPDFSVTIQCSDGDQVYENVIVFVKYEFFREIEQQSDLFITLNPTSVCICISPSQDNAKEPLLPLKLSSHCNCKVRRTLEYMSGSSLQRRFYKVDFLEIDLILDLTCMSHK